MNAIPSFLETQPKHRVLVFPVVATLLTISSHAVHANSKEKPVLNIVANKDGDLLERFLQPTFRAMLTNCKLPGLEKLAGSRLLPGDFYANSADSGIYRIVKPVWNQRASLDAVFSLIFKTNDADRELYADLSATPLAYRGAGLGISVVPSPRSGVPGHSFFFRDDTCASTMGATVAASAGGSTPFAQAQLEAALRASAEGKTSTIVMVGSFLSPLAVMLGKGEEVDPQAELEAYARLWRYFSRHKDLLTQSALYYLETFDGAAVYTISRSDSTRQMGAKASGKAGFSMAGIQGASEANVTTSTTVSIDSYAVYLEKRNAGDQWPLSATLAKVPMPRDIAAWTFHPGVVANRLVVGPSQPFDHVVDVSGIPDTLCNSNFIHTDDNGRKHISYSVSNPTAGACKVQVAYTFTAEELGAMGSAATTDINYNLVLGEPLTQLGKAYEFKLPVEVTAVPFERDLIVVAGNQRMSGSSDGGSVTWKVPYYVIDKQSQYDSTRPIDLRLVKTTCSGVLASDVTLTDVGNSALPSTGEIELVWKPALASGQAVAVENSECTMTIATAVVVRQKAGKTAAPTTNIVVRLARAALKSTPSGGVAAPAGTSGGGGTSP